MDRNPDQHDETLLGNDRPRDHARDELRSDDRDVTERPVREGGALDGDDVPGVGDHIGEAAGGISGVLTGAAIGSAGGPVGTLIGGIAGAIGGWWAGHALSEAARRYTDEDDSYYRAQYESSATRATDRTYDDVRPAYQLGHIARLNPDYTGRNFEDIETDLQRGWTNDLRARHGDWSTVRPFAEEAYTSRTSVSAREATNRMQNSAENLADRASDTTRGLADRAVDAVDNVKDRVDGNPASKPGPDPTDRRF